MNGKKLRPVTMLETITEEIRLARVAAMVGSPCRHLVLVDGSCHGRPEEIVLLPPFSQEAVASSWWPVVLCKYMREE